VPVWLHPADRPLYDHVPAQAATLVGMQVPAPPPPDHEIVPGHALSVGTCAFDVRYVPGHSPGSVAFVGEGMAFVGDAVFAGSVGRVDLPGGDGPTLIRSIREQILTLPDETVLYPGHGPDGGARARHEPVPHGGRESCLNAIAQPSGRPRSSNPT